MDNVAICCLLEFYCLFSIYSAKNMNFGILSFHKATQ